MLRLTQKRQQILSVLKTHHGTLSAADVHQRLPNLDLVTIYRNLDVFVKARLIKRVALPGKEAQYEYQAKPHHHAICEECQRVIHFTASDEKIKQLLDLSDFQVDEIEVTVHGVCNHPK